MSWLYRQFRGLLEKMPYGQKIIDGIKKSAATYTAHNVALGFAIGVLFGTLPTLFGIEIIIAAFVAALLRASKAASILGALLVVNPLVGPFFMATSFYIASLFGTIPYTPSGIWHMITHLEFGATLLYFTLGYAIVSITTATIAYIVVYSSIEKYHKRMLEKQIKQNYNQKG